MFLAPVPRCQAAFPAIGYRFVRQVVVVVSQGRYFSQAESAGRTCTHVAAEVHTMGWSSRGGWPSPKTSPATWRRHERAGGIYTASGSSIRKELEGARIRGKLIDKGTLQLSREPQHSAAYRRRAVEREGASLKQATSLDRGSRRNRRGRMPFVMKGSRVHPRWLDLQVGRNHLLVNVHTSGLRVAIARFLWPSETVL